MVRAIVGYDRRTELLATEHAIPAALRPAVRAIVPIAPDDPTPCCPICSSRRRCGISLASSGHRLDLDAFDNALEPVARPVGARATVASGAEMVALSLPENLRGLHAEEESVRMRSITALEASPELAHHASMIESSMDLIDFFSRQYPSHGDDDLVIKLLGIRLFNGAAAALKLLLSGYYQTSALLQRDILETVFLLDYFTTNTALIAGWREGDEKKRMQEFRPVKVRTALDDRDGFTERKREKAYDLLSKLAGHPTYVGFRMLTSALGGEAKGGPFFEPTSMKALIYELAIRLTEAATIFTRFFPSRAKEHYIIKLSFMEAQGLWVEKFFGRAFDSAPIEELRALLRQVK